MSSSFTFDEKLAALSHFAAVVKRKPLINLVGEELSHWKIGDVDFHMVISVLEKLSRVVEAGSDANAEIGAHIMIECQRIHGESCVDWNTSIFLWSDDGIEFSARTLD